MAEAPSARPPPARGARPPTILVVEDDFPIRSVLVECLEEHGFDVLEAANATGAIQLLSYSDFAVDGIITDIRMPGEIDGLGLIVWAQQNRPGIPILVTSAVCADAVKKTIGARVLFCPKPYDCTALAVKLIALLQATG